MRFLLCVTFCASLFLCGCGSSESVKTDTKDVRLPKGSTLVDTHTTIGRQEVRPD